MLNRNSYYAARLDNGPRAQKVSAYITYSRIVCGHCGGSVQAEPIVGAPSELTCLSCSRVVDPELIVSRIYHGRN